MCFHSSAGADSQASGRGLEVESAVFPSTEFPDVPQVRLAIPAGWRPLAVAGTLIAAVLDRGAESFSPNVVVTHDRVIEGSWEDSEASVLALLDTLVDLQVIDRQRVTLGGRPWSVFEFAHAAGSAGTVIQVIATTRVEHETVTEVVRVTASTDPVDLDVVLPELRRIVAGTQITAR